MQHDKHFICEIINSNVSNIRIICQKHTSHCVGVFLFAGYVYLHTISIWISIYIGRDMVKNVYDNDINIDTNSKNAKIYEKE